MQAMHLVVTRARSLGTPSYTHPKTTKTKPQQLLSMKHSQPNNSMQVADRILLTTVDTYMEHHSLIRSFILLDRTVLDGRSAEQRHPQSQYNCPKEHS